MYKVVISSAAAFFALIVWVIYQANTGGSSIFFDLVRMTPYGDKVGHFFLFGILTLLFNLATRLKAFRIARLNIYFGSLAVTLFVLLEELSQALIPSRTLDITDVAADLAGILLFTYLSLIAGGYMINKSRGDNKQYE